VSALCLFVDDLDPSNAGFGLRFVDFWMILGHSVLGKVSRFRELYGV
jgi:hypothetical protein